MPIGIQRFAVALRYHAIRGSPRQGLSRARHCVVAVESALDGMLGGNLEGLLLRLVHDQIGLVITHVGTIMKSSASQGARRNSQQRFCEFAMIVRELLRQLAGGGIERNTIARRQGSKESRRRIADEHGALHGDVHVVEDHGDKSLWQENGVSAVGTSA